MKRVNAKEQVKNVQTSIQGQIFLAKWFPSLILYVTISLNANNMDSGTTKAGLESRLHHSWASLSLSFLIYKMKIVIVPNSIIPNCCED